MLIRCLSKEALTQLVLHNWVAFSKQSSAPNIVALKVQVISFIYIQSTCMQSLVEQAI